MKLFITFLVGAMALDFAYGLTGHDTLTFLIGVAIKSTVLGGVYAMGSLDGAK